MTHASLIILSLLASALELDTTYAFQTLLSRPILAGPIFGLVTGDMMAGLQVGVFAELLFCDISPLGGVIPPSGVVATVIPMLLYAQGIELYFGFFLGILAAVVYSLLDGLLRKNRLTWLVSIEKRITRHPGYIRYAMLGALLLSFTMTFIFVSVTGWLAARLIFMTFPYLTYKTHFAFALAYNAVPWIGLATLIPTFRFKAR